MNQDQELQLIFSESQAYLNTSCLNHLKKVLNQQCNFRCLLMLRLKTREKFLLYLN